MISGCIDLAKNPNDWYDSSIVRHLSDPFSDAALAESTKTYVDAGAISIGDNVTQFYQHTIFGCELKRPAAEVIFPDDEPEELLEAHGLFISYAKKLIGDVTYNDSYIELVHDVSDVDEGKAQRTPVPHLDGLAYKPHDKALKLVGIATNILPPVVLQGLLNRDDLTERDGYLKEGINVEERFEKEYLPVSRLILLSPATLHVGQLASSHIFNRHLLRYQLFV